MNKKGQSLVMFVICLPLVIFVGCAVIDVGLTINRKLTIENIIENKNISEINETLNINNIDVESIEYKNNCVIIKDKVKGIFVNVIDGIKYDIEIKKCE